MKEHIIVTWPTEAPEAGTLGSAGLDGFLSDPSSDPAFAGLDNGMLCPHHASSTVRTRDRMAQLVDEKPEADFAGRPLLTPVN